MFKKYKNFFEWVENFNNLNEDAKHTVKIILGKLSTENKQEIQEKVEQLEVLDLSQQQIKDLSPIAHFTNLQELILTENQIIDLTPLGCLNNLKEINLNDNKIEDLRGLANLKNLKNLWLSNNKIKDLTAISNLNNLVNVGLSNNKIENLSPLSNLKKINYLGLANNLIRDLSPLERLQTITFLWLHNNQIADLKPLTYLKELIELWLDNNPLDDLSVLTDLENLTYLHYDSIYLPKKYWQTPFKDWQSQWILEEKNAEIRRVLIKTLGYEKLYLDLKSIELDSWREYTLIKIPQTRASEQDPDNKYIQLLKMVCPSTNHIHVLRVPPNITLVREAVRWVNWGIDPEEFVVET